MDITKHDDRPAGTPGPETVQPPAGKSRKNKNSVKKDRRTTAAIVMDGLGSLLFGATILMVVLAVMFGPAITNELREDEIMSVLDMSEDELAGTSMGDLIDIRKYVDEYRGKDEVNKRAAEKAGRILDEAIEDRIK